MSKSTEKTRRLVGLAIFSALVVILQLLAGSIKIGVFSFSLVLIPIVVGAAVYGPSAGAILGGVFGLVVCINIISGADAGSYILWSAKPVWTILLAMSKGILAGYLAGLTYLAVAKKNITFGVMAAAIVCPIVNTGVFCIGMITVFRETLISWAGGTSLVYFLIVGLIGINFLIEMAVNVVLSPAIVRIIKARRKEA
jgi:uncharacterized membrane protein